MLAIEIPSFVFDVLVLVNLVMLMGSLYLIFFTIPFHGPIFAKIFILIPIILTLGFIVLWYGKIEIAYSYKLLIGISALCSCFWLIQQIRLEEQKKKFKITIEALSEILLEDTNKPFSYFENKISARIKEKGIQWYAKKFNVSDKENK